VPEKPAFADIDDGNAGHDGIHRVLIATRRSKLLAAPGRNNPKNRAAKK
jgi:hypothetical protein